MNTAINNAPHTDPRFVSVKTLAVRYDVSESTIWRWLRQGIIPKDALHRLGPTTARLDLTICDRSLGLTD